MINEIIKHFPYIPQNDFDELLNIINQSKKFQNHFNENEPDNRFEFAYASYLCNQNEEFLAVYYDVVLNACFNEFLEWYEYISKNILRKDIQKVFGYELNSTDKNWEEKVQQSEVFGWSLHIKDTKVFLDNIDKAFKVGLLMKKFFNDRTQPLSILDEDYFASDHAQLVLDSIEKILIHKDKNELTSHLYCDKILCMIEVYGWENRFNFVLLRWIYENRDRIKEWA
jgi:hypothetical protein